MEIKKKLKIKSPINIGIEIQIKIFLISIFYIFVKFKNLKQITKLNINLLKLFFYNYKLFKFLNKLYIIKFTINLFKLCINLNVKYVNVIHKNKCIEKDYEDKIKNFISFLNINNIEDYDNVMDYYTDYVYENNTQYTYVPGYGIVYLNLHDHGYDITRKDFFFYNMHT
jgi:hypothetical protein